MHTNNHPTNYVLKYISIEILKILKIDNVHFDDIKEEVLGELPYSIYSYNYFKFEWLKPKECNEEIFKNMLYLLLD